MAASFMYEHFYENYSSTSIIASIAIVLATTTTSVIILNNIMTATSSRNKENALLVNRLSWFSTSESDEATTSIDEQLQDMKSVTDRSIEVSIERPRLFVNREPKTVFLIRHAESAENHRLACLSRSLSSLVRLRVPDKEDVAASVELLDIPAQVDSHVSIVGEAQISQLQRRLQDDHFLEKHNVSLIVHSPLLRARETCKGMLGYVYEGGEETLEGVEMALAPSDVAAAAEEIYPSKDDNTPDLKNNEHPRVVQLECLKERTPSEWLPYGNLKLVERIDEFEDWLNRQPEEVVCVVGHSQYFKSMLGLSYKFGNCDVWRFEYEPQVNYTSDSIKKSYSRKDDFQNYDGPSIDCGKKTDVVENSYVDGQRPGDSFDDDPPPSYKKAETIDVPLPRGWSKMECLYRYAKEVADE
mmetsp:Transcript_1661/g.2686  ORF Transcript_1661/g.2686 Transcript_1661/m.2686 type:complete len:413 (-) Transcript_1661:753-1991(-)